MTAKKLFLFWMLVLCQILSAQQDTIVHLKEVILSDSQLKNFSGTQSVLVLKDSVIQKNQPSLTSLLNYNSTIYFKENGLGMVSSPSFRGTSAQQTAVIWNGININSQLNGQTDFNTITTKDFDNITVRAGGGSSIYGSSAIGGSIHLNTELRFAKQFKNELQVSYGSFNTFGTHYRADVATEKWSVQVGISRNSSANDYKYLDSQKQNENGQFENTSLSANFGYRISKVHFIKYYTQTFDGERHFSGTLASVSKSKYQDFNFRNLLAWESYYTRLTSKLKVAFWGEKYKYFENAATDNFETAKTETFLSKYDLNYKVNSKISISTIFDYTQTKGTGSAIGTNTRKVGSATVLLKQYLLPNWHYEWSCRKEMTEAYTSPFLVAFGTDYGVTKAYHLLLNVSRNYRNPTFNDLYWAGLGNADLKPESSYQAEFGQQLQYRHLYISGTVYYMNIEDLIQWLPNNTNGNWNPTNVAKVKSYGAELRLNWKKNFGNHDFDWNANYGYTISKDCKTDLQLIYVPFHKLTSGVAYSYKKLSANYQYLFNGYVYTATDHHYFLKEYQVSNVEIATHFGKSTNYQIGIQVLNLWNANYQSVPQRLLPGRNYTLHLTLKF